MKLEQMIDLVRNGTLEAVWWVDPQDELARAMFLSQDMAVYDPPVLLASLLEEEGAMAATLLMAMVVYSDSRVCPSADEHRSQYKYNAVWKIIQCEACATVRKESFRVNRAQIEPTITRTFDLRPPVNNARQ